MPKALHTLLAELERFGEDNDRQHSERPRRMLNITRDTGEFLDVLVRATQARRVLEIGTSNGYSTLWLAEAARSIGGRVTSVEYAAYKVEQARRNFAQAGLQAYIELLHADAGEVLAQAADESADLIFLDSERGEYPGWWPDLRRVLRKGGLLVVDNASSHATEMAPFVACVEADGGFRSCLVPVGKGEYLATRTAD